MTKIFIFTLGLFSIFLVGCGDNKTTTPSTAGVSFPTTPPDCGNDCPPAFPSA
jgi:hypothetical protein